MRTLTLYRDDSTVQVVYTRVKSVFWTAGNSVLVISRYDAAKATRIITFIGRVNAFAGFEISHPPPEGVRH